MKGKPKNEMEMLLITAKAAIEAQLEAGQKGVIVEKGTAGEGKMSYRQALIGIQKLDTYFGLKGCMSIGLCNTCTFCNKTAHCSIANCCGTCSITKKDVHDYDTCFQHSKKGGGWGI